uniref:Uncharacterized protein n=1 Tax=Rhizophora mucronata TaxID=61149 RepID=A0A2P2Q2E5_RHIMU
MLWPVHRIKHEKVEAILHQ